MRTVRASVELRQGEKVEMLFTPRLYLFKGEQGVDFVTDSTLNGMYALYADILYCAALNAWTLEGNNLENAPFNRVDFHEWSATNPQEFGKAISFALKALSGRSLDEFIKDNEKGSQIESKPQKKGEEVKKKTLFRWIMEKLNPS